MTPQAGTGLTVPAPLFDSKRIQQIPKGLMVAGSVRARRFHFALDGAVRERDESEAKRGPNLLVQLALEVKSQAFLSRGEALELPGDTGVRIAGPQLFAQSFWIPLRTGFGLFEGKLQGDTRFQAGREECGRPLCGIVFDAPVGGRDE